MPWPTAPVVTTGMDNDADSLPRSDILDLATKFNQAIAMRGVADGICDLDGYGIVPVARIPAAIARLASPALTGNPTAPTQALRNNSTRLATTAFVLANGLLNGALRKTAAYAVAAADYGKLVDATTGTWALTMNPATLGANFVFAVRNSGSGVVTLTPSTGTIDGAATLALNAGESCLVFCDGTNFETVGRTVAAAIGVNQSWKTVTRSSGTSYQNTTDRPIVFSMAYYNTGTGAAALIEVSADNVTFYKASQNSNGVTTNVAGASAIVPAGHYYKPTFSGALVFQSELSA